MVNKYVLRPLAEHDIAEIWTSGADRWGIVQADCYFDGMIELFERLSFQPDIARLRREFVPPVRFHVYGSHLVIFDATDDGIEVLRVLHQRQDIFALLGD